MLYTQGKTDCSPAEAGFDESRVDVLNRHFQRLIDTGEIQCASYCVSRRGKVFLHGAVGPRSYKNPETPLKPDDINGIASMTKPFAATAVMQLIEDGLTRLEVPVGAILPQFNAPPFNKINLFHLLTHTSGMHPDVGCFPNPYNTGYWGAMEREYMLHGKKKGDFDWIKAALSIGVRSEPGQEWMYCSFGYAILGAVVEKLTGGSVHTYIEERIAKPLGLQDTFFTPPPEKRERYITSRFNDGHLARLNSKEKGCWAGVPQTGGGMSSTPYDLMRFGNAFLNGGRLDGARILGRKTVEKMTTLRAALPNFCWGADGTRRLYGLGFDMVDRIEFTYSEGTYCHEGAGAVSLDIDPKEQMVAAWFVPFANLSGWYPNALYSVQNILWSGLV